MKYSFLKRQLLTLSVVAISTSLFAQKQNIIHPCEVWPDEDGNHIQAHGGGIIKINKTYYWYGEDRTPGGTGVVACYSSTNLLDWKRDGMGLRYVHHFSPDELSVLASLAGFHVSESFLSDGESGNLGLYQVWTR